MFWDTDATSLSSSLMMTATLLSPIPVLDLLALAPHELRSNCCCVACAFLLHPFVALVFVPCACTALDGIGLLGIGLPPHQLAFPLVSGNGTPVPVGDDCLLSNSFV